MNVLCFVCMLIEFLNIVTAKLMYKYEHPVSIKCKLKYTRLPNKMEAALVSIECRVKRRLHNQQNDIYSFVFTNNQ